MKSDIAKEKISSLIEEAISSDVDLDDVRWEVQTLAKYGGVDPSTLKSLIVSVWEDAVVALPGDEPLPLEKELRLLALQTCFSLSREDLNQSGAFSQVVRLVILRKVMDGQVPEVKFGFPVPFELQDESLVWAMRNVAYYKERTRVERIGFSHGVEMMADEGLLFQADDSPGRLVNITEYVCAGAGTLGITNKHVYFQEEEADCCIPLCSIDVFETFSDGVVLHTQAGEPLGFETGDGSYLSRLLIALKQNLT